MNFDIRIATGTAEHLLTINQGETVLLVGANGTGKSMLAAHAEQSLGGRCHRISGHRALTLNADVPKLSQSKAASKLYVGNDKGSNYSERRTFRWGNNGHTALLNDFDALVQFLFAEQSNTALNTHNSYNAGLSPTKKETSFEKLKTIWGRLILHRELKISGDSISVLNPADGTEYPANLLSDGERAVFYLIGQTLCAPEKSLVIFDEPELHIHRAILSKLWDELEALRPDCGLLLISHDLEFVGSRKGRKYVIDTFAPPATWTLSEITENNCFDEQLTTLILGSRRPVLFVEGASSSLDVAIYRNCYPEWTVIPSGSCSQVIQSVVGLSANPSLTRITCAGIVDADGRSQEEIACFEAKNIYSLPVSEIENVIMLPAVSSAIASELNWSVSEVEEKLKEIGEAIVLKASGDRAKQRAALRFANRRVSQSLRDLELDDKMTLQEAEASFEKFKSELSVTNLAAEWTAKLDQALASEDIPAILALFDDKGLLSECAKILKEGGKVAFEGWLMRTLRSDKSDSLRAAFKAVLPNPLATVPIQ